MADVQITIIIKDKSSAKQWLAMVEDIDTDYQKAMTDAAETLINMKDFADGTIVDEICKYGDELMNAAQKVFGATKEIANTVNTILSKVDNFVEGAVGAFSKLASKVLN